MTFASKRYKKFDCVNKIYVMKISVSETVARLDITGPQ